MNLYEYQQSIVRFVRGGADSLDYERNGFIGEIGELFGVVAKNERGDVLPADALAKEGGDVLWMVARLCTRFGRRLDELPITPTRVKAIDDLLTVIITSADRVYKMTAYDDHLDVLCWHMGTLLAAIQALTGCTVDELAALNYAKLLDREQRGVLVGSGDTR